MPYYTRDLLSEGEVVFQSKELATEQEVKVDS